MVVMPHNHGMWGVIGVYSGREDNILWRRLPDEADGRIEAAGARELCEGGALALGPEIIHSVVNPLSRVTGAIHVYGGDFFGVARSEWDPESLRERPYDMEKVLRMLAR
jgi:predicted metal-dependent enzyme (double-stranded beta helix superfamily)